MVKKNLLILDDNQDYFTGLKIILTIFNTMIFKMLKFNVVNSYR